MGCAIPFLLENIGFYRSGWPSGGSGSMVFTVRIEGRKKMGRCRSGVYIDFYRSDSIWAGRPPLPPTLDVYLDVDPRALPYIGL